MFSEAFQFILLREGGYVDHPADRVGPTNYGITQGSYDAWRSRMALPTQHVRDITAEEVEAIYRHHYWIDGRCDEIAQIHPKVAIAHMDSCVNHGLKPAARLLQRAISTVKIDGAIGPITMSALQAMSEDILVRRYLEQRYRFYMAIVRERSSQKVFLSGWLARIRYLAREIQVEWHQ